jgi:hypothetical protein
MDRYILRFRGDPGRFSTAVAAVEKLSGVKVVDRTTRMLLVEATSPASAQIAVMSEWSVSPETYTPLPDTRKQAR